MKIFEMPENKEKQVDLPKNLNIKKVILKKVAKNVTFFIITYMFKVFITAFVVSLILKYLIN